jgi:hypothetical protein
MKHKHTKRPSSPRAKLSIVIEKLEKRVGEAEVVLSTCVQHTYCMPPV